MAVDPNRVFAVPVATSSVAPIPTIVPTPPEYQTAGDTGKRALWVVAVVMALSSLAFYVMAVRVPVQKRVLHIITALITTTAFLSYFAMAAGDGITFHHVLKRHSHHHDIPNVHQDLYRQVYWARYVDWAITTPLLLLDLSFLAGLPGANILVAVAADLIMFLSGLFAAFGSTQVQKWGWYALACIAFLVILYQIGWNGRRTIARKNTKTKTFVAAISAFTFTVWLVYPVIWAVAGGTRIVGVDGEIIAYAVLDILAKPVFGFWLLTAHDALTSNSPSFRGFWSEGYGTEGTIRVGDDEGA